MKKFTLSILLILLQNINLFAQGTVTAPIGYSNEQLWPVNAMAVDTNYNVWLGFGKIGLGKFDRFLWTMYDSTNSGLPHNNILSVVCNKSGVWAGTDTGLYNFNGTTWSWLNTSNSNIPSDTVPQLYSSGGNDLFIFSTNGFVYFNGTTFNQYNTSNSGLVDDTVQCVLKSATGLWWIGTKHGLSSFDGSNWQSYTISSAFSCSDDILSLNEDKNNLLFVGTYLGGLFVKIGAIFTNLDNYLDNLFYKPSSVYNQFKLSDGNILVTDSEAVEYIVSTNPVVAVTKSYTSFDFPAPSYLYAIDRVNRIYRAHVSPFFNMTYTDSINIPPYNDSVNLQNYNILAPSFNYLSINEVECPMSDNNFFFWDRENGIEGYFVPKSDCGPEKSTIFTSSLWFGGLDAGGNLHVTAQTYSQGGHYWWDGPLDTITAALDASTKARFDTIWKIDKDTLNQFIIQYNLGNVSNHTYQVPSEILDWPAQGSGSYAKYMAPFVDHNGDGIYNPYDGDYPQMKGDQMLWWIMNDNYDAYTGSGFFPFGLEVRSEAYAYSCQSVADNDQAVNYTTFYSDSIINRSDTDYNNVYIGIWEDPDLGYAFDDYVGCRIDGNYAFDYNGTNNDAVYGVNPPMISTVLFNDTMTHFQYYNNDFSAEGNPFTAIGCYQYLQSIWLDSTHVTFGGNGHGSGCDSTSVPTNYMFSGIPYDTGWTEASACNTPGDRRFLMSLGPITLKSKQSKNLDYAIVFSWDKTQPNGDTTSVAQNDRDVRKITHWFQLQNFPCDYTVGINEPTKNSISADIYPNPALNYFYVRVPVGSEKMKMDLIDITGRIIRQQIIYPSIENRVSTDKIAAGVYLVKVSDSNAFAISKVVIE